jgi:hypothetical protein
MNEIQFGSRSLSANNHIGGRNPYIAKFDSAGNCQWIRGGTGSQLFSTVYTVVCDNDANVYYTANLDSTLTIELNTLQTSDGLFYYCKYTSDGNLVWVHQAGNSSFNGGEASSSLVIDASNIMWNSGWINGPATFGVFTLPGMSSYIAKLDLDGTFLGAIGGTGIGSNYQSVLDGAGNLYLGGAAFGDTISFDGNTLVNADDTLGVDFLLRFCTPELGITPAVLDKEQISLFPDPTSGKFTLRLNNSGNTTEKFRLDIVNVLGSSLYSTTIQPGTDEVIDLSGSDPGIYLVKLTNGKRTFSRKLILQ